MTPHQLDAYLGSFGKTLRDGSTFSQNFLGVDRSNVWYKRAAVSLWPYNNSAEFERHPRER